VKREPTSPLFQIRAANKLRWRVNDPGIFRFPEEQGNHFLKSLNVMANKPAPGKM
jgi:hypothetical protein